MRDGTLTDEIIQSRCDNFRIRSILASNDGKRFINLDVRKRRELKSTAAATTSSTTPITTTTPPTPTLTATLISYLVWHLRSAVVGSECEDERVA
jgi:hypothetical protein